MGQGQGEQADESVFVMHQAMLLWPGHCDVANLSAAAAQCLWAFDHLNNDQLISFAGC